MSIRVKADGTIEVDTLEEALALQERLRQKNGDSQRAATSAYYEQSRDAALEREAREMRRESAPAPPAPAAKRRFRPEPPPATPAPPPVPEPLPPPAVALPAAQIREAMAPRSRWDAPPAREPAPVPEQIPDPPAAVAPLPPAAGKRGSPESLARQSAAMTASWERRRQAKAARLAAEEQAAPKDAPAPTEDLSLYEGAVAPPAAAPAPAPPEPPLPPRKPITPKKALAYKLPPGPPPRPAKKPPWCASCFKLGHLQAECPHRPAPRAPAATAAPSPPVAPEEDDEPEDGPDEVEAFVAELDAAVPPPAPAAPAPAAPAPVPVRLPVIQDAGADLAELGGDDDFDPASVPRPRNRSECRGQQRPCPWVGCDRHLFWNIDRKTGAISEAFPGMEPWQLPVSCVDDVADKGGATLEEIGGILGVTRERIRQIEVKGIKRLKWRASRHKNDYEDPVDRRSNSAEDSVF